MGAPVIVPIDVTHNGFPCLADGVIGVQVDPFVLQRLPEALDEHVVAPSPFAIHTELAALGFDRLDEIGGRELAALIGVDDLRPSVTGESLFEYIYGMTRFQRNGDFGSQHLTTDPVNDAGQVDKAFGHRDIGRIQRPDLVGFPDGDAAQEIRVDRMPRMLLASARLAEQGFNAHAFHEVAYPIPADMGVTQSVDLVTQLPGTHEGMLQVQAVDVTHEFQILRADRPRQVIDAAAANARQLGLLLDG